MADAFNEHMPLTLDPGWLLPVDESMVAWRGKVGLFDPSKCPFRSYVPRKPGPLGLEVKNTGCALSGLLIFLEFCEGKASHAKAKYYYDKASDGEIYSHTTATSRPTPSARATRCSSTTRRRSAARGRCARPC
jgi:hypothetical protein